MEKEEIKNYITQSLYLLMKNTSYEKITMDMIANKAGVSRRTIYRYFINKQEILDEFFSQLIESYKGKINDRQSISNIILTSFEFIFDNFETFIIAKKNNLLSKITNVIEEVVKKIVANNQNTQNWSKDYLDYYTSFVSGGIYLMLYEWFKHDTRKSPNEMFELYKNVISDLDKRISDI